MAVSKSRLGCEKPGPISTPYPIRMNLEFSLLSLNTYGVPFFLSWGRLVRLARVLEQLGPTVICLQEIQQNAYTPLLVRHLPAYHHQAFFPHVYAPKGGLGTFSRVPLTQCRFTPYPDRGLRFLITLADWALFKGVLTVRLLMDGLDVFVLNTHLNANYIGYWHQNNPLALVQRRQVQVLSRLLKEVPAEALAIVCGDLNFPRATFLYEELVTQNGLSDPLRDDPRPTYRLFPRVSPSWGITLDYILLRIPKGRELDIRADLLPIQDSSGRNRSQGFLSDHCALTLNVHWNGND